jgi:mono/diheme cytochrome c family protein
MFFHFFRSNRAVVQVFPSCIAIKIIAFGFLTTALSALADEGRSRTPVLPLYQQECAACHIAYPAGMLPAPSWQRLMGGLQKHFGTDASLDEASVRTLSAWLQTNAGNSRKVREAPAQDRISRADWFVRQHHEVDSQIWKQPAVKSAANCAACHTAAERGSFRESEIQFPKGLDARFRSGWSD